MNPKLLFSLCVLGLAAGLPVHAQNKLFFARVSAGTSHPKLEPSLFRQRGLIDEFDADPVEGGDHRSVGVGVGWQFTDHFALEAGFNDLGRIGVVSVAMKPGEFLPLQGGGIDLSNWTLGGRGSLQLSSRWSLDFSAGVQRWQAKYSLTGTGPVVGGRDSGTGTYVGIRSRWSVARWLDLGVELERHHGDLRATTLRGNVAVKF
jgi:hypothetical protein